MNTTTETVSYEEDPERAASDRWDSLMNPTKLVAFYRRMPTTTMILAPYLLLFLPPAFIFGNSAVWFLIGVALIALCGTVLVDLFWPRVGKKDEPRLAKGKYGRGLFYLAFFAVTISSIVGLLAALAGKGSVAVQTGRAEISSGFIATLDGLIGSWGIVGIGLLVAAYLGGKCSKKELFGTLAVGLLGTAVGAIFTQITAPLFSQITFLVMFLLLFGLIKFRFVIIGICATLYVWPLIYEIRNQLRVADGVKVSDQVSAFDRIRFDLQFSRAQELDVPIDISATGFLQHPTIIDVLRYGLIPRLLDPDRAIVSTGRVINIALGGTSTSAYTFGPITTIYVLEGAIYLFFYYVMFAVLVNWVWQRGTRITPVRLMLLAILISGPLGWFSTQPDVLIGATQSLTASVPLFLALSMIRKSRGRPTGKSETTER